MSNKTIVLIEDFGPTRNGLTRLLTENGFRVIPFAVLQEARDGGGKADLWICDGNLQKVYDGFAFAQELQDKGNLVLCMSSDEPPPEYGIKHYVQKIWGFHGTVLGKAKELLGEE